MRKKINLIRVRGGLQWLHKRMSSPFRKAVLTAVLIVCVDLMSAACSSSRTETLSLETSDEPVVSTAVKGSGQEEKLPEEKISPEEINSSKGNGLLTAERSSGESVSTENSGNTESAAEAMSGRTPMIYVFVCGAVERAGVYVMPEGSRVCEAVSAAGGFTLEADETAVNQALMLQDQDQLYIPARTETEEGAGGAAAGEDPAEDPAVPDARGTLSGKKGVRPAYGLVRREETLSGTEGAGEQREAAGEAGGSGKLVNINTADAAELEKLPGIGSTKAEAIAAYRAEHGFFRSAEDLKNVSGIGDSTYEKLKSYVTVGNP